MANQTGIEWCDATWNPVVGCTAVSPGCEKCYAARQAATRLAHLEVYKGLAVMDTPYRPRWNGKVRMLEDRLREPLKWRKPMRIFVNSMSDLFHKDVTDEFLDRVFAVMALTPQHTYQVLTKRPERMREYMGDPATPHRVARALDALTVGQRVRSLGEERIEAIPEYPGYYVSDRGVIYSEHGSARCVHCGVPIEGRSARARYCSKRCRQNAHYRLRTGRPMHFPPELAPMAPDAGTDQHQRVMLYRDGEGHRELVHRLVLTVFDRPPLPGEQACHLDGDPTNNALPNLRWDDQSGNWDDRKRHGRGRSYHKLTDADVRDIRERAARGKSAYRIAQDYPVSDTQVRNIITGAQWSAELPFEWPLPSVWAGTSVEDQQRANERIPHLRKTPAAVRFLSCEPLLARLNLPDLEGIDWVIVGGETGPGARRMNPDWAREIRDNCKAAGVPFFMKQMSGREPIPDDLMIREWPRGEVKDEEKWSLKNDVR